MDCLKYLSINLQSESRMSREVTGKRQEPLRVQSKTAFILSILLFCVRNHSLDISDLLCDLSLVQVTPRLHKGSVVESGPRLDFEGHVGGCGSHDIINLLLSLLQTISFEIIIIERGVESCLTLKLKQNVPVVLFSGTGMLDYNHNMHLGHASTCES